MLTGGSMGDEKSQNFALMQVFRGSASATKVADNSFCAQIFLPLGVSHYPYINTQL